MYQSILTICIGNICRSPMAEALLKAHAQAAGKDARIDSAGIAAVIGAPADPMAVDLMARRGIDIGAPRGRQVTFDTLRGFDLILVMTQRQRTHLEQLAPVVRGRVFTLGHWGQFEVADPYGQPVEVFERALERNEQGVDAWKRYLS